MPRKSSQTASPNVELVLDAKAQLGEGSLWHAAKRILYWIDILGCAVHVYDPATGKDRTIGVGQPIGTIVPRRSGGVMLALQHGFAQLDLETEKLTMLCDPERDGPGTRFNDGKCDPAGRFWAGTMPLQGRAPVGSLYCLYPDHTVKRMLEQVSCSNGIAWSLDQRTMYYIDTPTKRVDAFDYDVSTGAITNRRPAVLVPPELGSPDGSTLDAEGMLWVAHWGAGCVTRWNPANGQRLRTIQLPVPHVSSCAFGGPKLDQLYITSAAAGLDPAALAKHPLSGGLFRVEPGVCGLAAVEFAG